MESLGLTGPFGSPRQYLHLRVSRSGKTFASAVGAGTPVGPPVEHARRVLGPPGCHPQEAASNDGLAVARKNSPRGSPATTLSNLVLRGSTPMACSHAEGVPFPPARCRHPSASFGRGQTDKPCQRDSLGIRRSHQMCRTKELALCFR